MFQNKQYPKRFLGSTMERQHQEQLLQSLLQFTFKTMLLKQIILTKNVTTMKSPVREVLIQIILDVFQIKPHPLKIFGSTMDSQHRELVSYSCTISKKERISQLPGCCCLFESESSMRSSTSSTVNTANTSNTTVILLHATCLLVVPVQVLCDGTGKCQQSATDRCAGAPALLLYYYPVPCPLFFHSVCFMCK